MGAATIIKVRAHVKERANIKTLKRRQQHNGWHCHCDQETLEYSAVVEKSAKHRNHKGRDGHRQVKETLSSLSILTNDVSDEMLISGRAKSILLDEYYVKHPHGIATWIKYGRRLATDYREYSDVAYAIRTL